MYIYIYEIKNNIFKKRVLENAMVCAYKFLDNKFFPAKEIILIK